MQLNTVRANNAQAAQLPTERRASNPNAILSQYKPTGASAATARQDGLSAGVGASHKMANTDLGRLKKFEAAFEAAGKKHGVPPALLAAIASRESRAGAALDSNGRGDGGNGFGIMQVDRRFHTPAGGPSSKEHIDQAAGILKGMLNQVKAKHPDWPAAQQLRGAVAAYNSGASNVQTIKNMDVGTTGNDYSNDVWSRAQELAPHFGGKAAGGTGASGPAPSGGANTAVPTLQEGSKGPAVKQLQQRLEKLGFELGKPDGEFGPQTESAVKKFQGKHHLESDGVAGPKTQAAIKKALADRAKPTKPTDSFEPGDKWKPAPSLADVKSGKAHLQEGMQGPAVKHVQNLLGITADGKYGPGTKKAVSDFQHSVGNPGAGAGSVGPETLKKLEKANASTGANGISAKGREQMKNLLNTAQRDSVGKRPDGWCLKHVGDYLDKTSYGKIGHGAAPRLPMARDFGNWLNKNHAQVGMKKLNIDNPYKAPPGSIVVVRAGTPGTSHPTAGDIAVVGKDGKFYNGGVMGYGGSGNFPKGNNFVIGIFAPA